MSTSLLEIDSSLSLTERRVISLFAQYPEITFDPEEKDAKVENSLGLISHGNDSSPASTTLDEADGSRSSYSTAQTTPLRPLYLVRTLRPPDVDTVPAYLRRIRQTDLPEACRLCFTSLAQSIGAISTGMTPSTNGRYRLNNTFFMDQCSVLLRELQILTNRTKEQIEQVKNLKLLYIFKTVPTDDMLWAMYRQRAMLISKSTALPCPSELLLIDHLASLYNTLIYHPVQDLIDDNELEAPTIRILNSLYDTLFTWLAYYRHWCSDIRDLKQHYMAPLIKRLLDSKSIWQEVKGLRKAKNDAETAVRNSMGRSMLPMDERVLHALSLSSRKKEAMAKVNNLKKCKRFRRQLTI